MTELFESKTYRALRKPLLDAETLPPECYTSAEFHRREVRYRRPSATDFGPVDEGLEERRPKLEKTHFETADVPMNRLRGECRGSERDVAKGERLGEIDGPARKPRREPVEVD